MTAPTTLWKWVQDFRYLVEKDICNKLDEFGKCAQTNGRSCFQNLPNQEGHGCYTLGSGSLHVK
jgi:hypothetical protein